MSNSRTKNSAMNAVSALIQQFIIVIIGFVSRKIFLTTIGIAYLGVNGLFSNILNLLSMSELGVGTAIIYNLYRPLAENNQDEVCKLMNFYAMVYRIIAVIILGLGMILCAFLDAFINIQNSGFTMSELRIIFLLYLVQAASSYLFSYKRSLFFADQKAFLTTYIDTGYKVLSTIVLILVMLSTGNFYVYLTASIFFTLINNIIISIYADRRYPFLKNKLRLEQEKVITIWKNVKNIFIHKVAGIAITSTDNILISKFINITTVGLYSNYQLVIDSVSNVMRKILQSIQASVGNLLTMENTDRAEGVLYQATFVAYLITSFSAVSLVCLIQNFIVLCFGEAYLLPNDVVIVSICAFALVLMKEPLYQFVSVSGLFREDKINAIIGMLLNLGISIVLVRKMGLVGVFGGTVISSIITFVLKIQFFYSKFFHKLWYKYFSVIIAYLLLIVAEVLLINWLCSFVSWFSIYANFVIKMVICAIVPNGLNVLMFAKANVFKNLYERLKRICKSKGDMGC